jgi:hypothetical protein
VNRTLFAVVVLVVGGCSGPVAETLPEKLPEKLPELPLPKTPDGKFVLIEIGKSGIDLDPTLKDPLTALGGCTDLVTNAYAPGTESLDEAVSGVKACESQKPWELLAPCCPTECKDAFAAARANGGEEFAAFDQIFFKDPSCFPGVKDLVGGAP